MNTSLILQMAADGFADRTAVANASDALSYAELQQKALHAAGWLISNNIKRVAYLESASPAFPVAIFAAGLAGIPIVPLNYRLSKDELEALLARVKDAVLVTSPNYVDALSVPADIKVVAPEQLLSFSATTTELPDVSPDAVAIELFTSGTTGAPKAALLRHENVLAYILGTVEYGSAAEGDASIITVPPYHIAGISAVLSSCYAGRQMIQLPDFSAERWLQLAGEHGITSAFLVPTMLSRVVEYLDEHKQAVDLPQLASLSYGGGKMPLSTIERAMQLFPNVAFTNAYGLTETSSTIALLGPEEHREAAASNDKKVRKRLTSVGCPIPSVEIQIRDDSGQVVPNETPGGVFVRGDQVAGEYRGKGKLLDADGWFETKDIGYLDDGGYLFLGGRLDDVIVRGGENISPGEVERVLAQHPQVREAAVVALESEEWGEAVAAAVIADKPDEQTVQELKALVGDNLRSSRVPEKILFLEALPYNETGKLLRRVLREQVAEAVTAGRI